MQTSDGMDSLDQAVKVGGEHVEEQDVFWPSQFSQYQWYTILLDKIGGIVEDSVCDCYMDLQDLAGRHPVHYAAEYSNIEALRYLISSGCQLDVCDADNLTPLHVAAMNDCQKIAELLIDKGANVNSKTTEKMRPLHYAADRGLAEVTKMLIHAGATVDPLDANDRTPFMLAVRSNHLDVVEILRSYGAKVNIEDINEHTPLYTAVWSKSLDMARVLLRAGAKQTQAHHLLHYAVLHRNLAMVELLLEYGANPNQQEDNNLILIAYCDHFEIIKSLYQYGCKVDIADVYNTTPLHLAALNGCQEIAELLMKKGANVNCKAGENNTPLHYAAYNGFIEMTALLIREGAFLDPLDVCNRTPLMNAVRTDGLDIVEILISHGAKANIETIYGYSPLCVAVWNNAVDMVRVLLMAGAKPIHCMHLLHYTVPRQYFAVTKMLLEHGAEPNQRDDNGNTPLILAVETGHFEMIKLLLQYGANPNDENSRTCDAPLITAVLSYRANKLFDEILEVLCIHNVHLNKGLRLHRPLISALINEKFSIAASLIRAGADVNNIPKDTFIQIIVNNENIVRLMVAAGYDLWLDDLFFVYYSTQSGSKSLVEWLTYKKFNPRRLTDLSRLKIRSHVGIKILQLVPKLDIPASLKDFLLLQDT